MAAIGSSTVAVLLHPCGFAQVSGQLMLNGGRRGDIQIVSESWVRESTTLTPDVDKHQGEGYGYQWWQLVSADAYSAVGLGGQFIYVHPKSKTVIVTMSYVPLMDMDRTMADHGEFFDSLVAVDF